jgi:circadian clock protein KaiB
MSSDATAEQLAERGGGRSQLCAQPDAAHEGGTGIARPASSEVWRLRLYVSGESPHSLMAFANLKRLCDTYLPDRYRLEVVDLLEHPTLAHAEGIVAVPTLVRLSPRPARTVIGDLSDLDEVLVGLQIPTTGP